MQPEAGWSCLTPGGILNGMSTSDIASQESPECWGGVAVVPPAGWALSLVYALAQDAMSRGELREGLF